MKNSRDSFLQAVLGGKQEHRLIAVIGTSKNAGKTTFMNWLIAQGEVRPLGVITTGRDGEEKDVLTGLQKPSVRLPEMVYFTTTADVIERHRADVEILEKLKCRVERKPLWLVKTRCPIATEVVGPSTVAEQIKVAGDILSRGARSVFIDGSFDRKAITLDEHIDSLVLVVSPVMGGNEQMRDEFQRLRMLADIQPAQDHPDEDYICLRSAGEAWRQTEFETMLGHEQDIATLMHQVEAIQSIYLPSVMTGKVLQDMKPVLRREALTLVVKSPYQLQMSLSELEWLRTHIRLETVHPFPLKAIAVNTYSANGRQLGVDSFRNFVRAAFPEYPIMDVKEIMDE